MRNKIFVTGGLFVFLLILGVSAATAQGPAPTPRSRRAPRAPIGTEFTYQGQLKKNGAPVNGVTCNFEFGLYDDPTAGTVIGSPASPSASVTNGLFSVQLDFGSTAFNGEARWLEIGVMCPGDAVTLLSPRQQLRPTPYAIYASSTGALQGYPISASTPGYGQALMWNGNAWVPTAVGSGSGSGWQLTGNSGTNPSVNFLGTTDGAALELRVGNYRALRMERTTTGANNIIGGYFQNSISAGVYGATIAGGGSSGYANQVSGNFATISGGSANTANGAYAAIPGGSHNSVTGTNSFAAGRGAKANHDGSFVWNNSSDVDLTSTGNYQFLVRARGGIGINTNSPIPESLTVRGSVIVTGSTTSDATFISQGANSGIKMEDRWGALNPWTIYPAGSELRFVSTLQGEAVRFNALGRILAYGGFNGRCLPEGHFFNTEAGYACNMDFAESFAANELTEPGDVVMLVNEEKSTVRKSTRPYEPMLVGVVSTNPGLVFDNGETHLSGNNSQLITTDKTIVALVGRVPVKVSMEDGPIAVGDPLTSSSTPGVAMKATRAGKVIGYAMESKDTAGQALVLIQPGYYFPEEQLAIQEQNTALQKQNTDLEARVTALEQAIKTNNGVARTRSDSVPANWLVFGGLAFVGYAVLQQRRGGAL